jgi:hypothetical protein
MTKSRRRLLPAFGFCILNVFEIWSLGFGALILTAGKPAR